MSLDKDKIKTAINDIVIDAYNSRHATPDLYSNTLDCFSAVVDATLLHKSLNDWVEEVEKPRQTQKTIQNAIGKIHEEILGTLDGCSNLKVGKIVDFVCTEKKIVAEIKNKHNTTKGNHKVIIYDDIEAVLNTETYNDYTGYYVELLPKPNNKIYNEPFTPPDNTKDGERRPENNKIRIIDGRSFYELLTDNDKAIDELYEMLPTIIQEIISESGINKEFPELGDELKEKFFSEAYF